MFPTERLASAFGLENPQLGDERPTDVVSPEVVEIPFPDAPAARTSAAALYVVPQAVEVSSGGAARVAAFRGDTEVASYSFASNCGDYDVTNVFTDDAGGCGLVAFVCVGPRNPAGFGPCGACTSIDYEVVAVDGAGEVRAAGPPGRVLCEDEDDAAVIVRATRDGFSLACAGAPPGRDPTPPGRGVVALPQGLRAEVKDGGHLGMRVTWGCTAIVLGCLAGANLARAEQAASTPQRADVPPFRVGVDLVIVEATAVDKAGAVAKGARARDFRVEIGGRAREVESVELVDTKWTCRRSTSTCRPTSRGRPAAPS